jgi:hypothetical protein
MIPGRVEAARGDRVVGAASMRSISWFTFLGTMLLITINPGRRRAEVGFE